MTAPTPAATPAPATRDPFGRTPGLAPPVRPAMPWLWLIWLLALLAVVVLLLVRSPGPLDQRRPADQRDGLLDDGPRVPDEVAGVRFGGRVTVLVFERSLPDGRRLAAWRAELSDFDVRLVLPVRAMGLAVPAVADPSGELAAAVALPRPKDGGRGVGYAVVDAGRTVRYSTLDPSWLANAFEVATIAGSVE